MPKADARHGCRPFGCEKLLATKRSAIAGVTSGAHCSIFLLGWCSAREHRNSACESNTDDASALITTNPPDTTLSVHYRVRPPKLTTLANVETS